MKKILLLVFVFNAGALQLFAQQKVIVKSDTIDMALARRIRDRTLTKADSDRLRLRLQKYVKIDTINVKINEKGLFEKNERADSISLSINSCRFDDNANAMVLFDFGALSYNGAGMVLERHKRVKIFNDKGVGTANIRLNCTSQYGAEEIPEIAGRTMNFRNGKIEYTELDTKLIYKEVIDKNRFAVVFTMPDVKAGSVFEIGYRWRRSASPNIPGWDFQTDIPTQLSQFDIFMTPGMRFASLSRTTLPYALDTTISNGWGHSWAMKDIPALKIEPFMRSPADGAQSLQLVLTSVHGTDVAQSWASIGSQFAADKEITKAFDESLNDHDDLLKTARKLSTIDKKIEYLFDAVRNAMKWNGEKTWYSKEGIKKAWENKTGNWGEINMSLCYFLNKAGVKAMPMLVSTKDNGKIYRKFPNGFQLNKLVVYVPVDTSKYYVLDASDKYANFDDVPFDLLNSYGLYVDKQKLTYGLIFLTNMNPVRQEVSVAAEISADGTMKGTAHVDSYSYNKTNTLQLYNLLDEEKYKQLLSANENSMQITGLKLENATVDSLPLAQTIDFKMDLPGTDEKYIYFNPNLFTGLRDNPFTSEKRFFDIDFGCINLISITGKYKIPDGYKTESMPQNQTLGLPDKSITFRQTVAQEGSYINVYYVINYKRSFFTQSEYNVIYPFFKKLNDVVNQQIVLKKQ